MLILSATTSTEDPVETPEIIQEEELESNGDAQSDSAEIIHDSELELGSASEVSDNGSLDLNETVHHTDHEEEQELLESSPTPPRRSGRVRQEPKWLRSGDYITKGANVTPNWKQKAEFMASIMQQGVLTGLETEAGKALIHIIKES